MGKAYIQIVKDYILNLSIQEEEKDILYLKVVEAIKKKGHKEEYL